MKPVSFNKFTKTFLNYLDFATTLNASDNEHKGNISEEYWRRWFPFKSGIGPFMKIHNTNDKSSLTVVDRFPELSKLRVGTKNSPMVDLVIEYEDGYDLVSCKWWRNNLTFWMLESVFFVVGNFVLIL